LTTVAAFGAAAYHAWVAKQQIVTMNETLKETRLQAFKMSLRNVRWKAYSPPLVGSMSTYGIDLSKPLPKDTRLPLIHQPVTP
jgi:hypothetical protein